MVIEWSVLGGAAVKAAASATAGKIAGMLVEKGKAKIFPGELEKAIAAGFGAAIDEDETYSPSAHLFYHCDGGGQQRDGFLAKAIEHSVMLAELRKPLEGEGLIEGFMLDAVTGTNAVSAVDMVGGNIFLNRNFLQVSGVGGVIAPNDHHEI